MQNGVVDLRTGKLRPAGREDFVTKRCAFSFDPQAELPALWCGTLAQITGAPIEAERGSAGEVIPGTVDKYTPRPELVKYLQRVAGYLATGLTHEHKMFFLHGPPGAGKNLWADTVATVLGDYAATIQVASLMAARYASDGDKATPSLIPLVGARAAFCSETKKGQQLDGAVVKSHTGDRRISARLLHGASFSFTLSHKLVMLGNVAPPFDHEDEALHGRIHKIPFERRWNRPDSVKRDAALPDGDKTLPERLLEAGPGILAWMIRGAVAYNREGLGLPDAVRAVTQAYIAEQGTVGQWLKGWQPCAPREGTAAADLLKDYQRAMSDTSMSERAFGEELGQLGVEKARRNVGVYWGLRRPTSVQTSDASKGAV